MDNRPVINEREVNDSKPRDRLKPAVNIDYEDPLDREGNLHLYSNLANVRRELDKSLKIIDRIKK